MLFYAMYILFLRENNVNSTFWIFHFKLGSGKLLVKKNLNYNLGFDNFTEAYQNQCTNTNIIINSSECIPLSTNYKKCIQKPKLN